MKSPRKRKKDKRKCAFCGAEPIENFTVLFVAELESTADGICDVCVTGFFDKLCTLRGLEQLDPRRMTKH